MTRLWFALVVTVVLLPRPLVADSELKAWVDAQLARWEARGELVFASRCEAEVEGKHARSTLLLVPALNEGFLVEERSGRVVNTGQFDARRGPDFDLETNGGIYSRTRVKNLIRHLLSQPFGLHSPLRPSGWEAIRSGSGCPEGTLQ